MAMNWCLKGGRLLGKKQYEGLFFLNPPTHPRERYWIFKNDNISDNISMGCKYKLTTGKHNIQMFHIFLKTKMDKLLK